MEALVVKVVAPDLTMDRRAVATEPAGNRRDRQLGVEQAEDGAALVGIELPAGPRHAGAPSCKPLKNLQSRTSEWNPPTIIILG
jgi:hypothetical protein